MTPLNQNDRRLRQICAPVGLQDLRKRTQQIEIDQLLDFVYGRHPGVLSDNGEKSLQPRTVGLSANQVGIMKQICVVDMAIGHRGSHDIQVLINPAVVWKSTVMVQRTEGCVNFSELWGTTWRPSRLRVAALDRWGNSLVLDAKGWLATLLSHEIDHINGRLFIDRLADARLAHVVTAGDYAKYRGSSKSAWDHTIDVSNMIVKDPK